MEPVAPLAGKQLQPSCWSSHTAEASGRWRPCVHVGPPGAVGHPACRPHTLNSRRWVNAVRAPWRLANHAARTVPPEHTTMQGTRHRRCKSQSSEISAIQQPAAVRLARHCYQNQHVPTPYQCTSTLPQITPDNSSGYRSPISPLPENAPRGDSARHDKASLLRSGSPAWTGRLNKSPTAHEACAYLNGGWSAADSSRLTALSGCDRAPLRSPEPVLLNTCRIVSICNSPPANGGLCAA